MGGRIILAVISVAAIGIIGYALANPEFAKSIGLDNSSQDAKGPQTQPELPGFKEPDEVDPYYTSTTIETHVVLKKTTDGSKCVIRNFFYRATDPYEISPCPYELNEQIKVHKVCLNDDAPLELKIQVQPQCKVTMDYDRASAIKHNIVMKVSDGEKAVLFSYNDLTGKTQVAKVSLADFSVNQYLPIAVEDKSQFTTEIKKYPEVSRYRMQVKVEVSHSEYGDLEWNFSINCSNEQCEGGLVDSSLFTRKS